MLPKMFRSPRFVLAWAFTASLGAAQAPALDGAWTGSIQAAGTSLRIRIVFADTASSPRATIDIPQQGAAGLPLTSVRVEGDRIHMELAFAGAAFDGTVAGDIVEGTFTQAGVKGRFTLTRDPVAADAAAAGASGGAVTPASGRDEELAVTNGDVVLAGTLSLPEGAGPFPALVFLSGSGAQNRDSEVFGFPVFRELASQLVRAGFAVYRYDDRGVGQSTGSAAATTPEHVAGDALAALRTLRARPDIDRRRAGILGHSEGAWSAALAASRSADVPFLVLIAPPALRGDLVLRQQAADMARAQGGSDAAVAAVVAAHEKATEAVRTNAPSTEVAAATQALARAQLEILPPVQRAAIGDLDAYTAKMVPAAVAQLTSAPGRFMLAFEPAPVLRSIKSPVLALFGSLDSQVPPVHHLAPMREALSGNSGASAQVIEGANHLLQPAKTGLVTEYAILERRIVPAAVEAVTAWLRSLK